MSVNYSSKLIYGFKISFEDSETLPEEIKEKYVYYADSHDPKEGDVFFGVALERNSIFLSHLMLFPEETKKEVDNAFKKYFPEKEHTFSAVYLCLGVC